MREGKAIFSRQSLEEAQFIVADDDNRPDHMDGYNDDCIVADGVALVAIEDQPAPKLPAWSRFRTSVIGDRELAWLGT